MKKPPRIVTEKFRKRVIGADGGELLFVEAVRDMERCVFAMEKAELHFSTAGRRVKKSISNVFSDPDANYTVWFWAAVSSPEKPEFIRGQCLQGLKQACPKKFRLFEYWAKSDLDEMEEDREPFDTEIHAKILEQAGTMLVEACQRGSLIHIGEFIKHLSENYRVATSEEKELLRVIRDIAEREWEVPFQKDVREEWISLRTGRDEDSFRRTRDAIGFKWLPTASRGPQRI